MKAPRTRARDPLTVRRPWFAAVGVLAVCAGCGGDAGRQGAPAGGEEAAAETAASERGGDAATGRQAAGADRPAADVDTPASAEADAYGAAPADTSTEAGPMIHPQPRDVPRAGGAGSASWTTGVAFGPPTVSAPPLPVLTALRTGTHDGYERMVVEVGAGADGLPSHRVEYVDRPLIECGSGRQIFPVGDAWLEVRLEPAAAHDEAGRPTLAERETAVDGPLLQRVYRTCNFEGIVTLVMALTEPNAFRVITLSDPWRIVVDVRR